MAESGFKEGEIKCSCGESFATINEFYDHAREVHGEEV